MTSAQYFNNYHEPHLANNAATVVLANAAAVVFAKACEMGLEGIVSKRRGSFYKNGKSRNWLKTVNPAACSHVLDNFDFCQPKSLTMHR